MVNVKMRNHMIDIAMSSQDLIQLVIREINESKFVKSAKKNRIFKYVTTSSPFMLILGGVVYLESMIVRVVISLFCKVMYNKRCGHSHWMNKTMTNEYYDRFTLFKWLTVKKTTKKKKCGKNNRNQLDKIISVLDDDGFKNKKGIKKYKRKFLNADKYVWNTLSDNLNIPRSKLSEYKCEIYSLILYYMQHSHDEAGFLNSGVHYGRKFYKIGYHMDTILKLISTDYNDKKFDN